MAGRCFSTSAAASEYPCREAYVQKPLRSVSASPWVVAAKRAGHVAHSAGSGGGEHRPAWFGMKAPGRSPLQIIWLFPSHTKATSSRPSRCTRACIVPARAWHITLPTAGRWRVRAYPFANPACLRVLTCNRRKHASSYGVEGDAAAHHQARTRRQARMRAFARRSGWCLVALDDGMEVACGARWAKRRIGASASVRKAHTTGRCEKCRYCVWP